MIYKYINLTMWIRSSYCLYRLMLFFVFSWSDEDGVVHDWFILADKLHWKSREAREKGPTSRNPSSDLAVDKRTSSLSTINNNRTRGWEDPPRLFHPLRCQCGDWTQRWCWGCEFRIEIQADQCWYFVTSTSKIGSFNLVSVKASEMSDIGTNKCFNISYSNYW